MDLGLTGKIVLVTGGTRGIGLQIVKDFLLAGSHVIATARNQPGEAFIALSEQFPQSLSLSLTDVTNEIALRSCHDWIIEKFGKVDIIISNVGSGAGTKDPVSDTDTWNKMWNLNFDSAVCISRIFSEEVNKAKGSLLFISSIAGIQFIGAPTDYSVAKSALISFAKALAHRLAPDVRVNVIAPGNIWTEDGTWAKKMQADPDAVSDMLNKLVTLKRLGNPEEISNMALFLSSGKASFITGSCIVIDGGQTTSFH